MRAIRAYCAATRHCWFFLLMFCLFLCLQVAASAQTQITFTDADGNGLWSDGNNWNPPIAGGPDGDFNVTIPAGVGGPTGGAILDVRASIVNLTINPDAGLSITNKSTLTITGTSISNYGQLAVADVPGVSKTNGGSIFIATSLTLSGSGKTILNTSGTALISGTGTLINQQVMNGTGGGKIALSLQNASSGVITGGPSTNPLIISGPVTNSGMISGLGFTAVQFEGNTVQNAGGTIDATDSGEVLLDGCKVIGGTIGSASQGVDLISNLNGVTITGTFSVTSTTIVPVETSLTGNITNNGKIVVTSPTGGEGALLLIASSAQLSGSGQVVMSGTNASISGPGTLTNLSPHVISGGNITVNTLINESSVSDLLNISIKNLTNTNGTVSCAQLITGGIVQNGTINACVSPGTTVAGGATFSGINFTGGSQGVVNMVSGTLSGSNTVSTVMEANDNGNMTFSGVVAVNSPGGEILLNAFQNNAILTVKGSATMSGTGEFATSTGLNEIVGAAGGKNSLTFSLPTVSGLGGIWGDASTPITVSPTTSFTTGGPGLTINVANSTFTNHGTMTVTSPLNIEGNLANYNSTTNTLTGGTYVLDSILQFNNANLVNNAAKVTLNNGQINNQSGGNGLLNFSNNTSTGTLTLLNQNFTTGGTFSNEGTVDISAGSSLTIGGTSTNYNQSGTTAVTTVDGRLSLPIGGSANITGGTLQGAGQLYGDVSVGNAAGGAAATFIVGDSRKASALIIMENNYTQLATGVMDVQIGGTTVGSQYSQINVTGPVTLGGTLSAALINNFKPVSGDQFIVINAPSGVTGTFATVNIPKTWQVVYNSTSVVLEVQ